MKNLILFSLLAVAVLGFAAPGVASDYNRASTNIPAGPVTQVVSTDIDLDTKTITVNDTIVFDGTTVGWLNDSQALQTVYGDTMYETDGAGYDTGVAGYYKLQVYADTAITVNFNRIPLDNTDGIPLAASTFYTFDVKVPVIFYRNQSLIAGSGDALIRIIKFR